MPSRLVLLAVLAVLAVLAGLSLAAAGPFPAAVDPAVEPSPAAASDTAAADGVVPPTRTAFAHFARYVEAVGAGDLARARRAWRPEDLAAAARLGITRGEHPVPKVDVGSPLAVIQPTLLDSARADYQFGPAVDLAAGPLAGNVTLMLRAYQGAERLTRQYLFRPDGQGGLLLASRPRWLAAQGPGTPGRWVTVFERRPGQPWELPRHRLASLDTTVTGMLRRLQVPPERLAALADGKLHYLLVAPGVVDVLAGEPSDGFADAGVDMVVTAHPLHGPALATLVRNLWLGAVPRATAPVLARGLVTHLGGRWREHPRVTARRGRQALRDGQVTLAQLCAPRRFARLPADTADAAAGALVGFLLDHHGPDALRAAYRALSGAPAQVDSWSAATVQSQLAAALRTTWDDLAARLAAHLAPSRDPAPRLLTAGARPAKAEDRTAAARRQHLRAGPGSDLQAVVAAASGDTLWLEVTAATEPVRALLLAGGGPASSRPAFAAGPAPALLTELAGDRPVRGATHALVLDPGQARLYDLRTERLLARLALGAPASAAADTAAASPPATSAAGAGHRRVLGLAPELHLAGADWTLHPRTP